MSARKLKKVSFGKKEIPYFCVEDGGYLEPDDTNEQTYQITQKEIVKSVDITSAAKHFDLHLPHLGPYKLDYFRNGRQLLIGGRNGHVAAFDWISKNLCCEFNVRESVHAIKWLHMPTMFAVAQADWTHVYDEKGIEIHCLKRLYRVYELDFLPYHFLLVAASDNGFLSWLDISTGNLVANFRMKVPRLTCLTHNPNNAITFTGHPNGTVRLWSPNNNEPLVRLLCHPSAVLDVAVDNRGLFMVTTGSDRSVRIWDIRNYQCMNTFRVPSTPSRITLSQKNLLAIGSGNEVSIFNRYSDKIDKPYMRHRMELRTSVISSLQFCPFEDVLGIGHQDGFTSILVPGSGEANFDALEANPYMTKSQRREMEVKSLLEKINYELITLDADFLAKRCDNAPIQRSKVKTKRKKSNKYRSITKTADVLEEENPIVAESDAIHQTEKQQIRRKRGKKNLATKLRSKAARKEKRRRSRVQEKLLNQKKS
ncbi:wd repeat-containing protein 46-like protein [Dermatophagoides farinae]|mgnify:FL=1|uniref:Wd repeat-containing protein 46-like protein n=1 Tax=Dermatophagoides farinae TaxID=6954 RepID=A0A9D4SCA5_DERFA|nr:WD repeat-containing protein 46-like [Dermatophagoides farinae]KAH7637027.1 wd repeat-containing protein 46-like protein [Dermatophagoides farinae]